MNITISFHNPNPNTIWNRLKEKLGREPTNEECKERIFEILDEARINREAKK